MYHLGNDAMGVGSLQALPPESETPGLLHAWEGMDCSLYAKRVLYAPIRLPRAPPWPSLTGRAYASMMPS